MMRSHVCTLVVLLGASATGAAAQPLMLARTPALPVAAVSTELRDAQDSLIAEAQRAWHARIAPTLPGWHQSLHDVERAVGRPWNGLAPVVLLVPDDGRGFSCDGQHCLGRFLGARITIPVGDSSAATISSIVLVAESAMMRADVWEHELTHALLAQHGLLSESARHDRRYFRSDRTTYAGH